MTMWRHVRKDHLAGLLMVVMGTTVVLMGRRYNMGSLIHMGAGFIPVVIGVLMIVVGVAIALLAGTGDEQEREAQAIPPLPDLRGGVCILAAVAAFVLVGEYGGLIPATFVSVFIAAMGDRESTWKTSAALGVAMVAFGVVVFHYGLRVQLPLFTWGN